MASYRLSMLVLAALSLVLANAPSSALVQGAGSALDAEMATMMQMMRDEGIDIDARIEAVRASCRDRFASPGDEENSDSTAEAIENCAVVEKQIVYAQAINEMNANRRAKFDAAMAQHIADVAEADRLQREYEKELQDRAALVAAQDTAAMPAEAVEPAVLADTTPTEASPPPREPSQATRLAESTPAQPTTSPVIDAPPATNVAARGGSDASVAMPREDAMPVAAVDTDGPRIALVIGNEDYFGTLGELSNPVNDAVLIGATLRRLGFDVEILTDASQREMREAVRRFGDRLAVAGKDATGLFYYAGHGVQSQGVNYLIPVASEVDAESDLELEAIAADAVLAQMEESYVSTRIVILDACRNMPLRRRTRDGSRGLARMDTPNGSFLAYSTSPGNTAADGRGIHSPFAEALAEQMLVPDRPIEVTFREVRRKVVEATNGNQVPWDSSSLLETFSFAKSN